MSLNVAEFVEYAAEVAPDKTGLVCEDLRMTYAELASAANRVANALDGLGVRPGERVLLMLPNVPQFPVIYYGILKAGAVAVPINPVLREREIARRMHDSGARALFVWHQVLEEPAKARGQCPECEHLVVVEPDLQPNPSAEGLSFVQLLMAAGAEHDMAQTNPEDTAVLLYTSAGPGLLSGAELTHFNLFQNATTIKEHVLDYRPNDVCLAALPLYHSFGQTTMLNAAVLARSTSVLIPRFETHKVVQAIEREKVTIMALVPTMFHFLLAYKPDKPFDFSTVRNATSGGAKLPLDLAERFEARFGIPVLEGYGLTETSPVVAFNVSAATNRPGSVGVPLWGVRVRIQRADGSFAAPGEEGEVVIRGHNVMKGYYKQPEATAKAMAGGWLHTGDLGYLDKDGYLFLTGLKKDLVINSGMNVFPWEVEEVLLEHPEVKACAVAGVPDRLRGETVKAFVVAEPGATPTAKDLLAFCKKRIASYKCPRKYEFVEALPKTATGAVDKAQLHRNPM